MTMTLRVPSCACRVKLCDLAASRAALNEGGGGAAGVRQLRAAGDKKGGRLMKSRT